MTGLFSKSGRLRRSGVTVAMDITQEDDSTTTGTSVLLLTPPPPPFFLMFSGIELIFSMDGERE